MVWGNGGDGQVWEVVEGMGVGEMREGGPRVTGGPGRCRGDISVDI